MVTKQEFIDAQDVEIDGQKFTISRLPAFDAAPVYDRIIENKGIIPQNEKLILLSRCSLITNQGDVVLDKPILINTYVKKFQTLSKLIDKLFELNFLSSDDGSPYRE